MKNEKNERVESAKESSILFVLVLVFFFGVCLPLPINGYADVKGEPPLPAYLNSSDHTYQDLMVDEALGVLPEDENAPANLPVDEDSKFFGRFVDDLSQNIADALKVVRPEDSMPFVGGILGGPVVDPPAGDTVPTGELSGD